MSVLEVNNLRVRFDTPRGRVQAVDQVSFSIDAGESLAIVGESGSGKTITGFALLGLVPDLGGVVETGEVWFGGQDLLSLSPHAMRRLRGSEIAMVFQDPNTALNPFLPIGLQLAEVLELHRGATRREALEEAARSLGELGIAAPEERLAAFPHELSGGMRQRVLIAMALIARPTVLIADEPTTALDVTVQAQILDLLRDLRERHGTAMLLITHDFAIVAREAQRVHVMYAGRMVEEAATRELFERPWHPYSRGLLHSVPLLARAAGAVLESIPGTPPDLTEAPRGCAFQPRCGYAIERCSRERPELSGLLTRAENGIQITSARRAACFEKQRLAEEGSAPSARSDASGRRA